MTKTALCPACKSNNIFRFYEPKREFQIDETFTEIYDCKCPDCGKEFEVKDEFIDD